MGYDPDPITQAYRALRTALLADHDVRQAVKAGNFPNLTDADSPRPIKDNIQDADCPELLIVPLTSTYQVAQTNTGHAMTRRFNVRLVTAQQVAHLKLFPVQWALFAAFARIVRTNKTLGLGFVQTLTLVDDTSSLADIGDAQRSTRGWVSLLTVDIAFAFTDAALEIHRGT